MKRSLRVAMTLTMAFAATYAVSAAEIRVGLRDVDTMSRDSLSSGDAFRIHIVGTVEPGDYKRLVRECGVLVFLERPIEIRIDSPGADPIEAMKIGRFLRKMWARVRVTGQEGLASPTRCHGNAVLMLAGAPIRQYGHGYQPDKGYYLPNIGLRHPFDDVRTWHRLHTDRYRDEGASLKRDITSYLEEMGAAPELAERMLAATSGEELDLVPDAFIRVARPRWEPAMEGKSMVPANVSTDKYIEDYLPSIDPKFKASMLASCPEPMNVEEYTDMVFESGTESYRRSIQRKYEAYLKCEEEKLLKYQEIVYPSRLHDAGMDYDQVRKDLLPEVNSLAENYTKAVRKNRSN